MWDYEPEADVSNPTFIPEGDAADAQRPGPASAPTTATGFGTTVLPEVDRASARPVLRARSEARFLPIGRLGEGGLGEVVAAMDQDIGRKVAIKRIRTDRLSNGVIVRFLQEIKTVGRLEHANIIPIHDVGRDDEGALYFVMRHVDGETLEAIIAKLKAGDREYHRQFGFERRVQIVAAVLEALAFAHAHGVVHRDVKPANVMVGRYGEVLLLDWGIARLVDVAEELPDDDAEGGVRQDALVQTRAGAVLGTPAYMSPEQSRGEPADARSDVYAASVMLHEFLTLSHYLADCADVDAMLKAIPTRAVPLASMVASPHQDPVPMDLTWFVNPGVQKDPAKRYASVDAMLQRLARRAEGDIPVQCHVTFTKRASTTGLRFVNRHALAMAVVMALSAVTTLAGAVVGLTMLILAVAGIAFAA